MCSRCDTWQRSGSDVYDTWITAVFNNEPDLPSVESFCTIDCMMHWAAANSIPTERVEA